jgi:hypothetical protein
VHRKEFVYRKEFGKKKETEVSDRGKTEAQQPVTKSAQISEWLSFFRETESEHGVSRQCAVGGTNKRNEGEARAML